MQIAELEITLSTAQQLGLTPEEFRRIQEVLGRMPNFAELSIYAVMWSEHCSFKNSIKWLKTLPREGKRLIAKAGARGDKLVDIGDNLACAFKILSYNQPAANESFQYAGGIHRKIFALGARPVASLNSICFGDPASNRMKQRIKGVLKEIADFSNSFDMPGAVGEVYFHERYHQNILVHTLSVGVVKTGQIVSAIAADSGDLVFLVGSPTGKEGIHDSTFTVADLNGGSSEDLPAVQAGHALKKELMEALLEAAQASIMVGMQDLGEGGITAALAEMTARSDAGMRINLDRVPARQENSLPWEIFLSERPDGMLILGKAGQEEELSAVFEKWNLECVHIGEVTDTGLLEYFYQEEKIAEVPAGSLVPGSGAPVYDRDFARPAYLSQVSKFNLNQVKSPKSLKEAAVKLLTSPNLVSRRWLDEQYGTMVHTENLSDAVLIRIEDTKKGLLLAVNGNPGYVYADPYAGAMIAVARAARNIICSGAVPVAVTHSLNFGNPYDPEVYFQFVHVVKGTGDACRKFGTPVATGHVSFYNQYEQEKKTVPVIPTPVIGMLGLLENASHQMTLHFKNEGDLIYLLGNSYNDLGSSEYLRVVQGIQHSPAPVFDLHEEYELQNLIKTLISRQMLLSAHGISEGGLFTNLMESALTSGLGFNIETVETFRKECFLFGESQSRVVVTISPDKEDEMQNYLINNNVSFTKLGEVFGSEVIIDEENFGSVSQWKLNIEKTLSGIIEP